MNYNLPNTRMKDALTGQGIREVVSMAEAMERGGGYNGLPGHGFSNKVIHLEIGRPDYDSPACAKAAAAAALERGLVHYTDMSGLPELRQAIARGARLDHGMDVDADREVVVTVGAIEALATVLFTILEPGDEVIVPSPFFPAYSVQTALADGVLKEAPCLFEDGFHINVPAIEEAVTEKTRMILLNTPNNPTGAAARPEDLEAVAELARRHDLLVVSDECYEKFLYEGRHISIASLPNMRERAIIIGAASKTFSMTGWRVGWLILPPEIKPYAAKCHQHLTTCAASFAQAGVAEALRSADADVKRMIDGYRERRDFFLERLKGVPGVEFYVPEGAFYLFPRVSGLTERFGVSTAELAAWLLKEAGVAAVPGDVFHAPGNFLRMAYCRPPDELAEAAARIKEAIKRIW